MFWSQSALANCRVVVTEIKKRSSKNSEVSADSVISNNDILPSWAEIEPRLLNLNKDSVDDADEELSSYSVWLDIAFTEGFDWFGNANKEWLIKVMEDIPATNELIRRHVVTKLIELVEAVSGDDLNKAIGLLHLFIEKCVKAGELSKNDKKNYCLVSEKLNKHFFDEVLEQYEASYEEIDEEESEVDVLSVLLGESKVTSEERATLLC